eukprot:SM002906S10883  [mRNA]  locus=s2906:199:979:+ [translate_table: standard]
MGHRGARRRRHAPPPALLPPLPQRRQHRRRRRQQSTRQVRPPTGRGGGLRRERDQRGLRGSPVARRRAVPPAATLPDRRHPARRRSRHGAGFRQKPRLPEPRPGADVQPGRHSEHARPQPGRHRRARSRQGHGRAHERRRAGHPRGLLQLPSLRLRSRPRAHRPRLH